MTMPSFPPEFPPEFPHGPARQEPGPEPASHRHGTSFAADLLLDRRIVVADGYLDGVSATELSARLIMLATAGDDPIALHLRTPDGELEAAFAVAEAIGILGCPVDVLVSGHVGGSVLAVLAAAGRRRITPLATLRLTEPRARFEGGAAETAAFAEEHRRRLDAFYGRLAELTGSPVEAVREDARRGRLFTADQALAHGLVEEVLRMSPPVP